jgi:16S rRNA (cytidine1402-2'-O)-methyltransferase
MSSAREPRERGEPAQLRARDASPPQDLPRLDPGLYVVSTPIGRLRDVTLQALDVLAAADAVLAEDTRQTRRLCDAFGIKAKIERYDDHTGAEARPKILARLKEGAALALVSDAGTPLVSDPGYKLVKEAAEAGAAVFAVPGASAVLAALATAGLPTDRFLFAGFLPAKQAGRRAELAELASVPATLVFYETGPRLAAALADMADVLGDRPAAVARELTKLYEETRRAPLGALARAYAEEGGPKGEIVVVVGPPAPATAWDDDAVDAALAARLDSAPLKTLAAEIAEAAGRPRREIYARGLALKERNAEDASSGGGV